MKEIEQIYMFGKSKELSRRRRARRREERTRLLTENRECLRATADVLSEASGAMSIRDVRHEVCGILKAVSHGQVVAAIEVLENQGLVRREGQEAALSQLRTYRWAGGEMTEKVMQMVSA